MQSNLAVFKQQIDQEKLNHAYLFNGFDYPLMETTVRELIQYYYCLSPQKNQQGVCQQCANCRAIKAHEFPGIILINDQNQMIKIDQIRALMEAADYSDLNQKAIFFIINHAELMNENSQNALLKHLESPAANRYFFLLTKNRYLLLPTLVSRCEVIYFKNDARTDSNIEDPKVIEFGRLLINRNPLAYVVLTTDLKPIIKEQGPDYFLLALNNAYRKLKDSSEKARQLAILNHNLPQVGVNIDFARLMELFCLQVLSED